MSEVKIYVEGGGTSNELQTRCREGFRKLLNKSGFAGRAPRIVACGSRDAAFDAFKTAHEQGGLAYVALWVDSEDPVDDVDQTWKHLKQRDRWERPAGASDDQVFLMTTCMETWIAADRAALNRLYKNCLQEAALPALTNLERRPRHTVQDSLMQATRACSNAYAKNKHSFEALGNAGPAILKAQLPAFARMVRVLKVKLKE